MSTIRILALGATLALSLTTTAEARSAPGGTIEFMEFVAPTQIPVSEGSTSMMAMCHLLKKTHAVFIPLWYESKGYVLSDNNCAGDTYYSMTPEQMTEARALGLIGADVPETAQLSTQQKVVPFLWGALVLFGIGMFIRQKLRNATRHREIGGSSDAVTRLVDAMCHAAKADGRVDEREIGTIKAIALRLTGAEYPDDKIRRMIDLSQASLTPAQFAAFGKGLNTQQKELVMQAVLMVLGSDGQIAPKEQAFINGLAQGLGISSVQFTRIVDEARAATA
jgi:tellurite resistance protein